MFSRSYLIVLVCILCAFPCTLSHGHGHSHDHRNEESQEPPSFKYSREANTMYQEPSQHEKTHYHEAPAKSKSTFESTQELWMYAIGSTILISAAPFFILFLVPLDSTDTENPLLKVLLAFAAGGLLGDAFLHLIPHANMAVEESRPLPLPSHSHSHHGHSHGSEEHEHSHDMSVGLWVLAGIIAFLIVEKTVRIIKGGHGHSHHKPQPQPSVSEKDSKTKKDKTKEGSKAVKSDEGDTPKEDDNKEEEVKEIKVAGYLNLAADFSHNFTDGLAIGSSYLAGNTIGIVTTITILLHEVPHEIGDFAILLQSGVSRRKAMLLQLTTAVGAVAGTVLSLLAQNSSEELAAATWILPFTAGGFIYIALVSVIPELLDEEHPSFLQTLFQIGALFVGVGMMVLIAEYE